MCAVSGGNQRKDCPHAHTPVLSGSCRRALEIHAWERRPRTGGVLSESSERARSCGSSSVTALSVWQEVRSSARPLKRDAGGAVTRTPRYSAG